MTILDVLIAVAIGAAIWFLGRWFIGMLATPPPEVDPDDVVPVRQDYRCSVCGTEVTMTVTNQGEFSPPKHCREEMDPVWRP